MLIFTKKRRMSFKFSLKWLCFIATGIIFGQVEEINPPDFEGDYWIYALGPLITINKIEYQIRIRNSVY